MPPSDLLDCQRHAVLALDGEIDIAAAAAVRESLTAIVNDNTDRAVVIDLRDVTFMDSSGIGAVLSAYRRLKLQNRPLVVAEPQPIVARVLGITNVDRLLSVVDTVSLATDHCTGIHLAAPRTAAV